MSSEIIYLVEKMVVCCLLQFIRFLIVFLIVWLKLLSRWNGGSVHEARPRTVAWTSHGPPVDLLWTSVDLPCAWTSREPSMDILWTFHGPTWTVLNCYYVTYSGNNRVLNFVRNLKLAHILVIFIFIIIIILFIILQLIIIYDLIE